MVMEEEPMQVVVPEVGLLYTLSRTFTGDPT